MINIKFISILFYISCISIYSHLIYITCSDEETNKEELVKQFKELVKTIKGEVDSYMGKIKNDNCYKYIENNKIELQLQLDDNNSDYENKQYVKNNIATDITKISEKTHFEVKNFKKFNIDFDDKILSDDYKFIIPEVIKEQIRNFKKKNNFEIFKDMYILSFLKLQIKEFNLGEEFEEIIDEEKTSKYKSFPMYFAYDYTSSKYIIKINDNLFENISLETKTPIYTITIMTNNDEQLKNKVLGNDYRGKNDEIINSINNFIYNYKKYQRLTADGLRQIFLFALKENNVEINDKYEYTYEDINKLNVYIGNKKIEEDNILKNGNYKIEIVGLFIDKEIYKNIENYKKEILNFEKSFKTKINNEGNLEILYKTAEELIQLLHTYKINDYQHELGYRSSVSHTLAEYTEKSKTILDYIFSKIIEIEIKKNVNKLIEDSQIDKYIEHNNKEENVDVKNKKFLNQDLYMLYHTVPCQYIEIYKNIQEKFSKIYKDFNLCKYIPEYRYIKENQKLIEKFKSIYSLDQDIRKKIEQYVESVSYYIQIDLCEDNTNRLSTKCISRLEKLDCKYAAENNNDKGYTIDDGFVGNIKTILDECRYNPQDFEYIFIDENNLELDKNTCIPLIKKKTYINLRIILSKKENNKEENNKEENIKDIGPFYEKGKGKVKTKIKKKDITHENEENIKSSEDNNSKDIVISPKSNEIGKTTDDSVIENIKTNTTSRNNTKKGGCCKCCSCCGKT